MAVLGDVGHPGLGRRPHALAGDVLTVDLDHARLRCGHARDRVDQLLLAVAVDAGDRHDLTRAGRQRDPRDLLQPAVVLDVEIAHLEQRPGRTARDVLEREHHVAADDEPGEALLGRPGDGDGVDLLAAPQHRDAVGDLEHLAELVADEHDRGPVRLEAVDDRDQLADLLRGEHRAGLVEHEDPGVAIERLEDLDPLLGADRDVLDQRVGIDRQAVAVRQLAHAGAGGLEIEPAPPARLLTEHDVLGHRHHRHEHEVLVDHPDPQRDRGRRRADLHLLPVDEDLALVGGVQAVQHRHQRRFAGAVLTEQRMDLARHHVEVDPVVGDDRAEPLGDAPQLEGRRA